MNQATEKVISALNRRGAEGITHWDFPNGFALRSRIADLRRAGKKIITKMERNNGNRGNHARYFLIGQEK